MNAKSQLNVLARVGSFMANESHGKTDFVCALRNDFTEARAAVAELIRAARSVTATGDERTLLLAIAELRNALAGVQ